MREFLAAASRARKVQLLEELLNLRAAQYPKDEFQAYVKELQNG